MAKPPKPTEAELGILNVLWEAGPSTVREVMERLSVGKPAGYTTVLKQLQIMTEKALVVRDESSRTHVYKAAQAATRTRSRMVGDLIDRAFQGSTSRMVMQALSTRRASPAELAAIRELLDNLEEKSK
ncbi:MAG: BlaI/MecI/CopY family transcriptional regulator [Verrucomicrobiota bacterium]